MTRIGSVCGVIAEYNPFHSGHAYHLAQARRLTGADYVLCVMSGPFVQRGEAALLSPAARAEMALTCGADVVLELPALFACREAENFALGGVSLLAELGCITHLCFGAESDDLGGLLSAAELLEAPTAAFAQAVKAGLAKGLSHPRAQGDALAACLHADPGIFSKPNNILALCYLRALTRLNSAIKPVAVPRLGDYASADIGMAGFASASAVRGALCRGDYEGVRRSMPPAAYDVLLRELLAGRTPDAAWLDAQLRSLAFADLSLLPGAGEGLDQRLTACLKQATDREALLALMKTKRYPYARLSRLICHGLLGVTQLLTDAYPLPGYARLLGFRRRALPLLAQIKKGRLALIAKAADGPVNDSCYALDEQAYDLWAGACHMSTGLLYRQQVVITKE